MMIVSEVMSAPAITIEASAPVKAAAQLLDAHSITALPVVDRGVLVGVLSEADVITGSLPRDLEHHLGVLPLDDEQVGHRVVEEVMNHHPVYVRPDTDLYYAARVLTDTTVKSLPVVGDDGSVVAMVSRHDILHVLARSDSEIEAELDDRLRGYGDWLVEVDDGVATIEGPDTEGDRAYARATAYSVPGLRHVHVRT